MLLGLVLLVISPLPGSIQALVTVVRYKEKNKSLLSLDCCTSALLNLHLERCVVYIKISKLRAD